jgi:CubicO group peptidase (beta-lactamase class C family)
MLRPRLRLLALALALASTGCAAVHHEPIVFSGTHAQFPADVEARIRRIEARVDVPALLARYRVPGVSVAVVNGGVIEWARGYGVTEVGGRVGVSQETLFQAASLSKPVTSLGALRMVQDGRLGLDEDVNVRLSSWKVPPSQFGATVTLRQLLGHTGGVSVHGFGGYASGRPLPSCVQILDGQGPANNPPIRIVAPPGQRPAYSGGGYVIVQQLMSDVSGLSFADLMYTMVLRPLGMTHSTYEHPLPERLWPYAAAGHTEAGAELRGRWHNYPELAAAGLWTTPTDLARVVVEVQNAFTGRPSRLLSQPIAALMLGRHTATGGLDFSLVGSGGALRFQHGGVNAGYRAGIVATAYTGQGAVVMMNGDGGAKVGARFVEAIAAEYGWPSVDTGARDEDAWEGPGDGDGEAMDEEVAVIAEP